MIPASPMLAPPAGADGHDDSSVGRVYLWTPDRTSAAGGSLALGVVPLPRLHNSGTAGARLAGAFVDVRNAGMINVPDAEGGARTEPLGSARPDARGAFAFEPGRGGGRIDKLLVADPEMRWRYVQAARFGEVNAYYHLDRIAAYLDGLLRELGRPSLPRVVCVVNAHHGATEIGAGSGVRDGRILRGRWRPFQGGHYRLPARRHDVTEHAPVAPDGEIHLGPGRKLLSHGALVELAGGPYRANASHNPGIIYHEYGHHLTRHTADFRANALRHPLRQDNRKTAMDEGTCDYWTAVMLDTPHIWACHRRHDVHDTHPRSLSRRATMSDYVTGPGSDPHTNGTIWAHALWELRCRMSERFPDGAHRTDLMVLEALVLIGQLVPPGAAHARSVRPARRSFGVGLAALLRAGERLFGDEHRSLVTAVFAASGIDAEEIGATAAARGMAVGAYSHDASPGASMDDPALQKLRQRVPAEDVPASDDILGAAELEALLQARGDSPLSFLAGGDVMLGGRSTRAIEEQGTDYPFRAVRPLLSRAAIVMVNLEGPFAARAERADRQYSYRVKPALASALADAGVNVATLANNHLLDCGRDGVVETLQTLRGAGIAAVGAGMNVRDAHRPVILAAGPLRVGLLAYYWNRRCAATDQLPGSAMDPSDALEADIRALRGRADRIVVTFHWGVPYERTPSDADVAKARLAIDCGADAVIGHHPHVVQPFEVHRGCPIFYSVGNFAFGSGNSRAEGCLVGLRFEERTTTATVYPMYVKNRDPRVDYQPRLLRGLAARRVLVRLARESGVHGGVLRVDDYCGRMTLPRSEARAVLLRTGTDA